MIWWWQAARNLYGKLVYLWTWLPNLESTHSTATMRVQIQMMWTQRIFGDFFGYFLFIAQALLAYFENNLANSQYQWQNPRSASTSTTMCTWIHTPKNGMKNMKTWPLRSSPHGQPCADIFASNGSAHPHLHSLKSLKSTPPSWAQPPQPNMSCTNMMMSLGAHSHPPWTPNHPTAPPSPPNLTQLCPSPPWPCSPAKWHPKPPNHAPPFHSQKPIWQNAQGVQATYHCPQANHVHITFIKIMMMICTWKLHKSSLDHVTWAPKLGSPVATATSDIQTQIGVRTKMIITPHQDMFSWWQMDAFLGHCNGRGPLHFQWEKLNIWNWRVQVDRLPHSNPSAER